MNPSSSLGAKEKSGMGLAGEKTKREKLGRVIKKKRAKTQDELHSGTDQLSRLGNMREREGRKFAIYWSTASTTDKRKGKGKVTACFRKMRKSIRRRKTGGRELKS